MKKFILTCFAIAASISVFADGEQSRGDADEWVGIGTGAYQPGLLDYFSDEYGELMPAAVYESSQRPGVYKFVPTVPTLGAVCVYDIVVHTENPDKVWCEDASFTHGYLNLTTQQRVQETNSNFAGDYYGTCSDGIISFSTPKSFMVMDFSGWKVSNNNGNFALYLPGKSPNEDPIINDTWQPIGIGKYVEGLLDCEYKANIAWDVEIEGSVEHPGCYRLKPYFVGNPSCPNLPEVADTYIYIHAEDELEVYTTEFTLLNSRGLGYKIQHRAVSGSNPDYSCYGTLEDGIITFPNNSHYAKVIGIPGIDGVPTNTSGKACIALPGSDFEDYYVEAVHPTCALATDPGFCRFPLTLKGGGGVANVVLAVEAGAPAVEDLDLNSYLSTGNVFPNAFFGFPLNFNFPVVPDFNTNRWTMVLIALDSRNRIKNTSISTFFTPEPDDNWEDYAKGQFTDLIIGPSYDSYNQTLNVTIQRKKGTDGMLRIVNPYSGHSTYDKSTYTANHADHNHYIYINANDPDYVYIEEAPVGLDLGYGDVVASSAVGSLLNARQNLDEIKGAGIVAGKLAGGAITFPAHSLCFFETEYKDFMLQEGGEGRLLLITEYISGIEDVTVNGSNAPVEYYDLSGVRVSNPQPGQLYIMRQGGKAAKVIVNY